MNNAFKISSQLGMRTADMSIDWEFQPSLQHLVVRTEAAHPGVPTWAETMPASFESMNEPEIFRVFFGESERAAARA